MYSVIEASEQSKINKLKFISRLGKETRLNNEDVA